MSSDLKAAAERVRQVQQYARDDYANPITCVYQPDPAISPTEDYHDDLLDLANAYLSEHAASDEGITPDKLLARGFNVNQYDSRWWFGPETADGSIRVDFRNVDGVIELEVQSDEPISLPHIKSIGALDSLLAALGVGKAGANTMTTENNRDNTMKPDEQTRRNVPGPRPKKKRAKKVKGKKK